MKYRIVTRNGWYRPQVKWCWWNSWDFCWLLTGMPAEFESAAGAKNFIEDKARAEKPWLIVPPSQIPGDPQYQVNWHGCIPEYGKELFAAVERQTRLQAMLNEAAQDAYELGFHEGFEKGRERKQFRHGKN